MDDKKMTVDEAAILEKGLERTVYETAANMTHVLNALYRMEQKLDKKASVDYVKEIELRLEKLEQTLADQVKEVVIVSMRPLQDQVKTNIESIEGNKKELTTLLKNKYVVYGGGVTIGVLWPIFRFLAEKFNWF